MPTLNTPTLTLGAVDNDKRDVTVAGTVTFAAADIGKTFRLEIKVYGEDKSGDNLPAGDAVGDDLLYTYLWSTPFLPTAFKTFTVASAGSVSYSEKRAISTAKLDEDTGKVIIAVPAPQSPVYMPRKDEVYARVSLSVAPSTVTKRSATVTSGIGV